MNLFLDDIRNPQDAYLYTKIPQYLAFEWHVARNYDEFVKFVEAKGPPDLVSFDHDLAAEHYVPDYLWGDYDASKAYQESREYKEKTGYDCAKFLCDYCVKHDLKIPKYRVHSLNPVGAANIRGIMDFYTKKFN